jgi:hypothetical protein
MEEIRLILEEPVQPEKKSNILGNIILTLVIAFGSFTAFKYFKTGQLWFIKGPKSAAEENKYGSV